MCFTFGQMVTKNVINITSSPSIAQAGAPPEINYLRPNVSTTFLLDDVECLGNETDIGQCQHDGWGNHNCYPQYNEFASVTCIKKDREAPQGKIFLFLKKVPQNVHHRHVKLRIAVPLF